MTTNTEPYSVHTKKEPTISIASYQPITEKKPWRMTGGENFCKKCMTDKSFFIKNYKTCTDQCVHRFETLIDPSEQTSSSFSSYRSKQIDYYDFLVERECNLAKTWTVEVGEKNRTCFVNGWDEHAFLKLRTQDCGLTNNISLVTLFNMYTLIPARKAVARVHVMPHLVISRQAFPKFAFSERSEEEGDGGERRDGGGVR